MAYCSQCGTETAKGAKFCFECGAKIVELPVSEEAPAPEEENASFLLPTDAEGWAVDRESGTDPREVIVGQIVLADACDGRANSSVDRSADFSAEEDGVNGFICEDAGPSDEGEVPAELSSSADAPCDGCPTDRLTLENPALEADLAGSALAENSAAATTSSFTKEDNSSALTGSDGVDAAVEIENTSMSGNSSDIVQRLGGKKAFAIGGIAAAALVVLVSGIVLFGSPDVKELGISPVPDVSFHSNLEWPEDGAGSLLPEPGHPFGIVTTSRLDTFEATLDYADADAFSGYVAACKEAGFSVSPFEADDRFEAENHWGCSLEISYLGDENEVLISLTVPQDSLLEWPVGSTASSLVPDPGLPYGSVLSDTEVQVTAIVRCATEEDLETYVAACIAAGYTADVADGEGSFSAGNDWGCSLKVSCDADSRDMAIGLTVDEGSLLRWPAEGCATLLPSPAELYGSVISSSDREFEAIVKCVSKAEYDGYVAKCAAKGFSVDAEKEEGSYFAENDMKGSLSLEWLPDAEEMRVSLYSPIVHAVELTVDCRANWLFSQYDLDVYVDDEKIGSIEHGGEGSYSLILEEGLHALKATKKGSPDVSGACDVYVGADMQVGFDASCYDGSVGLSVFSEHADLILPPLADGEVRITFNPWTFDGDPYLEAIGALETMGLTNVRAQPVYDLDDAEGGWFSSSEGDVEEVVIAGSTDFSKGDVLRFDDEVLVVYHSCVWNEPGFSFMKCTVSSLVDELTSNAMRANEAYTGAYVEVTGVLESVDEDGTFYLYPDNTWWSPYSVQCTLSSDDQKAEVSQLSAGERVTVRGRITVVGEVLGYALRVVDVL